MNDHRVNDTRPLPTPPWDDRWLHWLTKNRLLGFEEAVLRDELRQYGFDEQAIDRGWQFLDQDPVFQAGAHIATRMRKRGALLDIYRQLFAETKAAHTCPRRHRLSGSAFFEEYYFTNRPVLISGWLDEWPARRLWCFDFLAAAYGLHEVEIQAGRDREPDYEVKGRHLKTQVVFNEFLNWIQSEEAGNNLYMVANNNLLKQSGFEPMRSLLCPIPEVIDPEERYGNANVWIGGQGTVTLLHHDLMNVLLAQVKGRKRVHLFPSFHLHLLYNHTGVYSQVNWETADHQAFPLTQYAEPLELILEEGMCLFIPVGWWHQVRALEASISLSFTNFAKPNHYDWAG